MKRLALLATATATATALLLPVAATSGAEAQSKKKSDGDGWVSLFDGKSLKGWKASENKDSVKVENGLIVVAGPRSHLFYVGDVEGAEFVDFEFKAEVKTEKNANSGIYFHTRYQEKGWPNKGYEAQANNTHSDRKKTGGLYSVKDVMDNPPVVDGEWFDYHIIVRGKHIQVKINGEVTADYTEPDDLDRPSRQLDKGTFALQAHDPKSIVYYRNIRVKPVK